jgi:hypothetical protein
MRRQWPVSRCGAVGQPGTVRQPGAVGHRGSLGHGGALANCGIGRSTSERSAPMDRTLRAMNREPPSGRRSRRHPPQPAPPPIPATALSRDAIGVTVASPGSGTGSAGRLGLGQRQAGGVVVIGHDVPAAGVEDPLGDVQPASRTGTSARPASCRHRACASPTGRRPQSLPAARQPRGRRCRRAGGRVPKSRPRAAPSRSAPARRCRRAQRGQGLRTSAPARPGCQRRRRSPPPSRRRGFVPGSPWVATDSPLRSRTGRAGRSGRERPPAAARRSAGCTGRFAPGPRGQRNCQSSLTATKRSSCIEVPSLAPRVLRRTGRMCLPSGVNT